MAVRTSNGAFGDLRLDSIGRETVGDHARDIVFLRSTNVIELQHHDVRFAAIDTSMVRQIIEDESPIPHRIFLGQRVTPDSLCFDGAAIIFAKIGMLTRLAVSRAASALLPVKLIERLFFVTRRASFHVFIVVF
jgi:hypothetical protein